MPYPWNYRLPDFTLFYGDMDLSPVEHIYSFLAQCGEADSDDSKLKLFVHSLICPPFSCFTNLPSNSVKNWAEMEVIFHEHFYRSDCEFSVAELAKMNQTPSESPRDYLFRFGVARNWCKTILAEK